MTNTTAAPFVLVNRGRRQPAATYIATRYSTHNLGVIRVTPLPDGLELVEHVSRDNITGDLEVALTTAEGTATATGSRSATATVGDVTVTHYPNRYSAPRRALGTHRAPSAATPEQAELAARCSAQRGTPAEGDRYVVGVLTGYQLVQNRPHAHRDCPCGDGVTTYLEGTVTRVVAYMDNSVEATVTADDGTTHRVTIVAPHGDACF